MSTYPGVGATRESISLDEDELSDVEDEVFIRDGRNGFKFSEDRGVKRPLMAPRRKLGKPDLASRLKNRPPCRVLCVPCCYAFAALSIFLGLIMLVIILVSLFPLPLDKLKTWMSSRNSNYNNNGKVLPCTDLNVSDVWSFNLPKLTSESTMRAVDVNLDGIDDIVFGFGIGEDVFLPEQWFCPMFLDVKAPCQGGIIALDGLTGQPLWKRWLHHAVFTILCTADISGDGISDCVASGKGGVLCAINGADGTVIWEFMNNKTSTSFIDIYAGSFIPDQDGDKIDDIIASHTVQKGRKRLGFLLIISGKTGSELVRVSTPHSAEIYYAPQLFVRFNGENSVLFGTGGQNTAGSLYMIGLHDIGMKNVNPFTIYEDSKKGVLSPVVLVDITGDKIEDIISAMYNSTIVAFDGITFKQLWNYTIPNSESLSAPTPGYFNTDNVTDFLVKYQVGQGFPVYYYSQTVIIDGKTGKPIYNKPIIDTAGEQMHGLTIRMEDFGNDIFLYWMSDCKNYEGHQDTYEFISGSNIWQKTRSDLCKLRFNSTKVTKLYAMNQYKEPPGILLYTSENRSAVEYNNSKLPLEDVRSYLNANPDFDTIFKKINPTVKLDDNVNFKQFNNHRNMKVNNAGSNFRHRDDGQTLLKDFAENNNQNSGAEAQDPIHNENTESEDKYEYDQPELTWNQNPVDEMLDTPQIDYETYPDSSRDGMLNKKHVLPVNILSNTNRDPRSKNPENLSDTIIENEKINQQQSSKKKNLAEEAQAITPNDFKNVYASRSRLLHDLNELPSEILRQTFEKNKALRQSRDSKYDPRDQKEGEKEMEKKEAKNIELPETLWDLESEKELEDRENGYYRGKREANAQIKGIPKITSTGLLMKPLTISKTNNAIDIVFATYWLLPKLGAQVLIEKDMECIRQKMLNSASSKDNYQNLEKSTLQDLFTKMCLEERGIVLKTDPKPDPINQDLKKSPYYNQISHLTLGQMTVYRIRLECKCEILLSGERCAQILDDQSWSSYMGKLGDGYFKLR